MAHFQEVHIVPDIKEKLCFVVPDLWKLMHAGEGDRHPVHTYKLPDGQVITLGDERFRCTWALFEPPMAIDEKLYDSIRRCDV